MLPLGSLSRRAAVIRLGGGGLAAALAVRQAAAVAAQGATPVANAAGGPIPAEITTIIEGPRYSLARWGIYVADRETGEAVYDLRGGERFLAASTTSSSPAPQRSPRTARTTGSRHRSIVPARSGLMGRWRVT